MTDNKKKEILADFYCFCGDILMGKADKEESRRITKAMVDSGQQSIMAKEFKDIGETLKA